MSIFVIKPVVHGDPSSTDVSVSVCMMVNRTGPQAFLKVVEHLTVLMVEILLVP